MEKERRKKSGRKIFLCRKDWILKNPIPCRKYPWVSFIQQLIVDLRMVANVYMNNFSLNPYF